MVAFCAPPRHRADFSAPEPLGHQERPTRGRPCLGGWARSGILGRTKVATISCALRLVGFDGNRRRRRRADYASSWSTPFRSHLRCAFLRGAYWGSVSSQPAAAVSGASQPRRRGCTGWLNSKFLFQSPTVAHMSSSRVSRVSGTRQCRRDGS